MLPCTSQGNAQQTSKLSTAASSVANVPHAKLSHDSSNGNGALCIEGPLGGLAIVVLARANAPLMLPHLLTRASNSRNSMGITPLIHL